MLSTIDLLQHFTVSVPITIRLCRRDDLQAMEWFGMFTPHRELILAAYESQERGEALLLVAESQGFPVGQVWIDITREHSDATGYFWAVRVFPLLQNLGIGTQLMAAAEELLRSRGCAYAILGVEKNNLPARRFYERQGYRVVGRAQDEYSYTTPDGTLCRVPTDQWLLRKALADGEPAGELSAAYG
jgi:ribosomal protein S18 acetylase RimI-like enzyme